MERSIEEFSPRRLQQQDVRPAAMHRTFQLRPWRTLLVTAIPVFVVLIVGSYALNWSWTGFSENKLWDWLELLVFPAVLTTLSIWFAGHQKLADNKQQQRRWGALWIALIALALVALSIVIIGGYALNWTWTGFSDNKLSDWLRLLFVPFVLPLVTVWFISNLTHPDGAAS